MEYDFYMDNWICHRVAYLLCVKCEAHFELLRSTLLLELMETYRGTSTQAVTDCLGFLIRNGYVELESIEDDSLKKCIEEVKASGDKRIKDPKKYCLKHKKGKTINILRPKSVFCTSFLNFLSTHPQIRINPPMLGDCWK